MMLESILNNPGLQHIAENIFCNLKYEDIEICRLVNHSCKKVLDEPMFWLKKFMRRGISMKDQLDWTKAIQLTKLTNIEKNVLSYLKKSWQNERVVNLPCYINERIVKNSKKLLKKYLKPFINRNFGKLFRACDNGEEGIIQILAPLMQNPNEPDKHGITPIHMAVELNIEPIVQILAPVSACANSCDKLGETPIQHAAKNGYARMIRILAPLIANPNETRNSAEITPFHAAAAQGKLEVVKILVPLINNINVTDEIGWNAMHAAALNGKIEVIKYLALHTEIKLNARGKTGDFPVDLARKNGHHEVVKFLESFEKPCKRARLH